MIIETTRFGEIECQDEEVLTFINGIPGFKEQRKYTLVMIEESPFMYLQSLDEGSLAFIVVSPFDFFPKYEFELPEHIKAEADIHELENVQIVNIVSIQEELSKATINLAAPIIINLANKTGLQYILPIETYSIHQPLFSTSLAAGRE